MAAFERAKAAMAFRSQPQACELKEIGCKLNQDPAFKKELAAKQAYDKALQQCAAAKNGAAVRPRRCRPSPSSTKTPFTVKWPPTTARRSAQSIRAWKDFTEAGKPGALSRQKKFIAEVSEKASTAGMKSYETKRFLFCSDVPPQIINSQYLPYLDSMYLQLCGAYGIDAGKNIWRGKAIVVAFANEASFQQFEMVFYHNRGQRPGHRPQQPEKNVLISCYCGQDPEHFAVVLVHETAHGFSWCYKSAQPLPNWLNEGASEWIAHRVVSGDTSSKRRSRPRWPRCGNRGTWAATSSRSTTSTPGSMERRPASPISS